VDSVFLGLATERPELEPSRDFARLSPFTGLQVGERRIEGAVDANRITGNVRNMLTAMCGHERFSF